MADPDPLASALAGLTRPSSGVTAGAVRRAAPDPHASDAPSEPSSAAVVGVPALTQPLFMPQSARKNYRCELTATSLFSFALAMVEGGAMGVIVKNAFAGVLSGASGERMLNYAVGIITAAPEFANMTSFLWAAWTHGKRKVRIVNSLQLGVLVMLGMMAAAPRSALGLWMLVACLIAARVCLSGVVTLRSTVWRANYDRSIRARVTGRLASIQALIVSGAGLSLGALMEYSGDSFRIALPIAAAAGLLGALAYSRVRVRHERTLLRLERAEPAHQQPSMNPLSVVATLRADRRFAWFMLWMFILGLGNLMLTAPLVITLREQFHVSYLGGIVVIQTLPYLVMLPIIPLWARYLDRVHIVRFRSIHSWAFVIAQGCIFLAALLHVLPLAYIGAAFLGVGFAGGTLAWNLGHLDFAPPQRASQYMGVHVTLNGVRGLVAPLVAVSAYEALDSNQPGQGGAWVFGISVVLCTIGAIGFADLRRRLRVDEGAAPGQSARLR
ncbi:MAG: MFS transporter [Phycisphaerales bacterium]